MFRGWKSRWRMRNFPPDRTQPRRVCPKNGSSFSHSALGGRIPGFIRRLPAAVTRSLHRETPKSAFCRRTAGGYSAPTTKAQGKLRTNPVKQTPPYVVIFPHRAASLLLGNSAAATGSFKALWQAATAGLKTKWPRIAHIQTDRLGCIKKEGVGRGNFAARGAVLGPISRLHPENRQRCRQVPIV